MYYSEDKAEGDKTERFYCMLLRSQEYIYIYVERASERKLIKL